ncbi:dopamine receptor 1-like isoform X2 [Rhodnius prolixus]|uniref:dopamine receptor 1-like isoform X2 n=1 Tax=Rhodnius prolixus TaxID=13249 RepID=UPI003D18925D
MDTTELYQVPIEYNETTPILETDARGSDALATLTLLLIGIFLSILIFLSIAGNILVCVAIYTDRGLRKIGNLFLASLAIADLFVAALVMTFAVMNDLLGYWLFGTQFCDTWIAFDVMCSTASILNLCAISLDRYIHIKDPLRYSRWVTKRVAIISIACIWLLAGLISFVPISMGLHRPLSPPVYYDGHPTCALDLSPAYAVVSSCISFYVPCIVMLGIYARLYCYAQKHVKSIKAVTRPLTSPSLPPMHHTTSSPYHVSDHKAAITVGVIMGTFLLCWVPFFCVNIVAAFCKTCIPGMAFKILTWLGYSNSAFNPIIYSIFNTEFREAFKRILTVRYAGCCCCRGYSSVVLSLAETKPRTTAEIKQNGRKDFPTPRSSVGSIRQIRVNSTDKVIFDNEEISAI